MFKSTPISRWILFFIFLSVIQFSCNKPDISQGVAVKGKPPVARAGEDEFLSIPFSNSTRLDGYQSTGDPLDPLVSFTWRAIFLSGFGYIISTTSSFQIRHNDPGEYLYELMVTSKSGLTSRDTVIVIAKFDSLCNPSRKNIPVSLKELAIFTEMDYPVICKASNKIALVANLIKAGSIATKIMLYDLNNGSLESQILENGRQNMGIAALDDKIYLAGGSANETNFNNFDIYDVNTKIWATEQLSESRSHCAVVAAEGKIFVAGGNTGNLGASDHIDIYNTINKNWETARLSEPRAEIFAQYADGKVYFIGGRNAQGISSRVDVYDCLSGATSSFKLPFKRHGFSAVVYQDKLYVAGGISTEDNENFDVAMDVQIVDLATYAFSYSCLSKPISWLMNTQGTIRNKKIVFPIKQANYYDDQIENALETFDPASGNWEKAALSLFDSNLTAVCVIDGKIFIILQKNSIFPPYSTETKLFEIEF